MENESKETKQNILEHPMIRMLLVGFMLGVFFILGMKIGAIKACDGYQLDGMKCINPRPVDLVTVCEYHSSDCFKVCQDFMILDKKQFMTAYPDSACSNR